MGRKVVATLVCNYILKLKRWGSSPISLSIKILFLFIQFADGQWINSLMIFQEIIFLDSAIGAGTKVT